MNENTLDALATIFGESDPKLKENYNNYRNLRDNFDEIVKRETKKLLKELEK